MAKAKETRKEHITFYEAEINAMKKLDIELLGRVVRSIIDDKYDPKFTSTEDVVFDLIRKQVEYAKELSEKRRAAANSRYENDEDENASVLQTSANAVQNSASVLRTSCTETDTETNTNTETNTDTYLNNNNICLKKYAEYVTLDEGDYEFLCSKITKEGADWCIEKLDNYKGSTGKRYQSDYKAILSWVLAEWEKFSESEKKRGEKAPSYTINKGDDFVLRI
jgi:hypothetical protein